MEIPIASGMRFFSFFGRFQIFSFQIISLKVVGFHLKVTKTQFWTGDIGGFRLFMACFRFFHAELSLMPVAWRCVTHKALPSTLKAKIISLTQNG